ncbi:hypothetical protein RvY_02606 [Ramazzottius varieornatus]|uniref:Uncharacterized protein n=1 Tax=Ramazzottius varieornatus TaxID=947166 RepID=A0A1D1UR39_RAMVA|nr:hypothetical protein RvY_02606 [Ramazzottius varieornatus]
MSSLGANVTIPDQVVLVGGTGKHLSDRFNFTYDDAEAEAEARYTQRVRAGRNGLQDRLGPRRYNGLDAEDEVGFDEYNRPHVLKRLGQPYNPWRTDQASYQNGQVAAGRSRGRYQNGYQNYYRGSSSRGVSNSYYNNYSGANRGYTAPYSYYGYSRPRGGFGNYSSSTYYQPFAFHGYGGRYRGRYNTYQARGNSRGNRRGGRNNRGSSRNQDLNQQDLDRDLDEYRQGQDGKSTDRSGDVAMS